MQENFTQQDQALDLAILFEVTGFQGESPDGDDEFWINYASYKESSFGQMAINDQDDQWGISLQKSD